MLQEYHSDLNNCYNQIKELLVSNDGKYLFDCILYLDYIYGTGSRIIYLAWLYIWDLTTKTLVNRWYDDHRGAREWKDRYPECVFKEWGY